MNTPQLRFPEFQGNWEKKKLGEIGEFKNGINKSSEDFGFGVPFINLMDVFGKPVIENIDLGLVNASEKEIEQYNLKKGDVLFIRSSVKKSGVGETSVVLNNLPNTVYSGFLIRFRDYILPLDLHFKKYCFYTNDFRNRLVSLSSTSANTNINQESLNSLLLTFPATLEQTKIASFLTAVDEKIQALKKKHSLLQQYKKGVMQKLFSQELRFKDENGNDFPDWEVKKLGEVATITTGSSNREDSILDGEYTFFDRSQDIRTSNRYLFDKEAIIVPGEGQEFIPKYFVGKFDLHQRTYAIFDFGSINGKFLFYSITFNDKHLQAQAVGSTVKSLRLPMFESMPINLPRLAEQTAIANFLSALDEKINHTQKQIEKTETWKKGLLQKMFC